ncbi:hypothetical protein [Aquibacillus kalidii]|uniref:hypothetical protein n=1 Tax=Aquibacillus kalidii TaxID=2762597 RepID=UPI0016446594|nr:hypothetical protein [Aquibacillus kalidii]
MQRLQSVEGISRLKDAFHKVFIKSDPFGYPFQEILNEKVLIFPTNGYYLNKNQFDALMKTIEYFGQGTFFGSESEGDSFNLSQDFNSELAPQHWVVESNIDYEGYQSIPFVVENSLYSPHGEWGLQLSHEDHAILAGNSLFINRFKEAYPKWEKDKAKFFQHWVEVNKDFSTDIKWIDDFIKQF